MLKYGLFAIYVLFEIGVAGALLKVPFSGEKLELYGSFSDAISDNVSSTVLKPTRITPTQ